MGRRDPTLLVDDRSIWRATHTPAGPGAVRVGLNPDGSVHSDGFGPGGEWMVDHVPGLIGDTDRCPDVHAVHDSVRLAQRLHGTLRIPCTMTPYHELIPTILAQRITAAEAVRQWRDLVMRFGSPAPGTIAGLMLPPSPEQLARMSYVDFHPLGVERKRAETIRQVGRFSHHLIKNWDQGASPHSLTAALMNIPGVGPWTAAVVGGISFGDPDAVQVGDFHVKNTVAWALEGRPRGTDDEMIESLEPYRGQRHRVVRWLEAAGWRAPLRGPRRRNVSIARL